MNLENIAELKNLLKNQVEIENRMEQIGLGDVKSKVSYAVRTYPTSTALYMSCQKNIWHDPLDAFIFFLIRNRFIYAGWLEPNGKFADQQKWVQNDNGWIKDDDGYELMSDFVSPHYVDPDEFRKRFSEWFQASNGTTGQIESVLSDIRNEKVISIYQNDYLYDRMYFGESTDKYFFTLLLLID